MSNKNFELQIMLTFIQLIGQLIGSDIKEYRIKVKKNKTITGRVKKFNSLITNDAVRIS